MRIRWGISTYVATAGIEYHPNYYQTFGLAFSWVESDAELGSSLGDADLSGAVVAVYGSWYDGPFYVDGLFGYGWVDHDLSRLAPNGLNALAETDSAIWTAQLNAGANFRFGGFVTGPYFRADYSDGDLEAYRESGAALLNLDVDGQNYSSLLSQLGWQISMPIEISQGTLAPHLRVAWVHEYLNEDDVVGARLVSFPANRLRSTVEALTDDFVAAGAGVSLILHNGMVIAFDYEVLHGTDFLNHTGSVSLSFEF